MNTSATLTPAQVKSLMASRAKIDALLAKSSSPAHAPAPAQEHDEAFVPAPKRKDFKTEKAFNEARKARMQYLVSLRTSKASAHVSKAKPSAKAKAPAKSGFVGIHARQALAGITHLQGKDAVCPNKAGVYGTNFARVVARLVGKDTASVQYKSFKQGKISVKFDEANKGARYTITIA